MRFMLKTKKTGVTAAIQTMLRRRDDSKLPTIRPLDKFTAWVRGSTVYAKT